MLKPKIKSYLKKLNIFLIVNKLIKSFFKNIYNLYIKVKRKKFNLAIKLNTIIPLPFGGSLFLPSIYVYFSSRIK